MDKAREDFYANFIAENSHDQGKLFRATCSLLKKETSDKLPAFIDAQSFVDDLGSFLVDDDGRYPYSTGHRRNIRQFKL